MNPFDRLFNMGREAKLELLAGEFKVVKPGDFVRCAVTGRPIKLQDLRYWNVGRQEVYIDAETGLRRQIEVAAEQGR